MERCVQSFFTKIEYSKYVPMCHFLHIPMGVDAWEWVCVCMRRIWLLSAGQSMVKADDSLWSVLEVRDRRECGIIKIELILKVRATCTPVVGYLGRSWPTPEPTIGAGKVDHKTNRSHHDRIFVDSMYFVDNCCQVDGNVCRNYARVPLTCMRWIEVKICLVCSTRLGFVAEKFCEQCLTVDYWVLLSAIPSFYWTTYRNELVISERDSFHFLS